MPPANNPASHLEPIVIEPDNPNYELFLSVQRYQVPLMFLMLVGRGQMLDELEDDLIAVSKAVEQTSKKASVTLKIQVAPEVGAKRLIKYSLKKTIPEAQTLDSTLWVTPQHQFMTHDPAQAQLPLSVVAMPPRRFEQVIKDVASGN